MGGNISIVAAAMLLSCHVYADDEMEAAYMGQYSRGKFEITAYQSDMGGGGYITGIVQSRENSDVLYARSDVAGVFKSVDRGLSWSLKNSGLTMMSDHYCHSLAIDPFNDKILLRASGDVRGFRFTGRIHRSSDGGETWHLVKEGLDYYGNGPTRVYGELITFNPDRKGEVAAGSLSKGIWLSRDSGRTWKYAGLEGERIAAVQYCDNSIYVSTVSDRYILPSSHDSVEISERLKSVQDFSRVSRSKIYRSSNRGKTWDVVYESESIPAIYEIIVADKGNIILFTSTSGVYRSVNGGRTFVLVDGLPAKSSYRVLVSSASEPYVLYTAEAAPSGKAEVPIYRSTDLGSTWTLLSPNCSSEDLSDFPEWHGNNPRRLGDSRISHILQDNRDPDRLYISNWWGITITDNLGGRYYGNYFRGIGIICCESLFQSPLSGVLYCGVCDHPIARSDNGGETFSYIRASHAPARVVCPSARDSSLLLIAAERKGKGSCIYRTEDGGESTKPVWKMFGKNFVQDIKEDVSVTGRFWAYIEGDRSSSVKPGIYISDDFGDSWRQTESNPFISLESVPADEFLIDRDLTPIVNYQYKNGCGTGQMLSLDSFRPGVVYAGEWTTGLYRTMDAGKTWKNIADGLPFGERGNAVLQFVYAHPFREGIVYAGFWNSGVWMSDDFGETWNKVDLDGKGTLFNASSMSISRNAEEEEIIAIGCSNHPSFNHRTSLWISIDGGGEWHDIYDFSLGSLRFVSVVGDASRHRIYAATAGNGVIYFDISCHNSGRLSID